MASQQLSIVFEVKVGIIHVHSSYTHRKALYGKLIDEAVSIKLCNQLEDIATWQQELQYWSKI